MTLPIEHLNKVYPFIIIAETGSIFQASKRLNTSQPALSQMLKTLENSLGYPLFTRSARGVKLTPSGERFYEMGKRVLSEVERFSADGEKQNANLILASYDGIVQMVAPDLVQSHHFKNLSLVTERTELALLDLLNENKVDLAIVADPPRIPGFQYEPLAKSPYGLYCTQNLKEQIMKSSKNSLESIQNMPLIYFGGSTVLSNSRSPKHPQIKSLESFIEGHSLGKKQRIKVDSFVLAYNLALQGMGIGLFITGQILPMIENKSLVEICHRQIGPLISAELYLVHRLEQQDVDLSHIKNTIQTTFKRAKTKFFEMKKPK